MNKIAVDIGGALFGDWHFLRSIAGVGRLVSILLNNAIVLAGTIFLVLILLAGFNMITAAGDTQKFQRAQQIITTALIGFIIILAAFMVIRIFELIFGLTLLGN